MTETKHFVSLCKKILVFRCDPTPTRNFNNGSECEMILLLHEGLQEVAQSFKYLENKYTRPCQLYDTSRESGLDWNASCIGIAAENHHNITQKCLWCHVAIAYKTINWKHVHWFVNLLNKYLSSICRFWLSKVNFLYNNSSSPEISLPKVGIFF